MLNDYLAHYGVLGMKWGVRNAETQRKYSGSSRKSNTKKLTSRILTTTGNVVKTGADKAISKVSDANQHRKEVKSIAKSVGTKRRDMREFKKLRKQTLNAHDPELVEKGMHTLTDSELDLKLTRLNTEKQVRDLAAAKRNSALETQRKTEEVRKARKERRNSGLVAGLLKTTYNATVNYAGKKAVDSLFEGLSNNTARVSKKVEVKSPRVNTEAQQSAVDHGKTIAAEVLNVETIITDPKRQLPSGKK